jgi:hypothetical protein
MPFYCIIFGAFTPDTHLLYDREAILIDLEEMIAVKTKLFARRKIMNCSHCLPELWTRKKNALAR